MYFVFEFSEFVNFEKVKPPIIKIIYSKFSNDILKIKHLKRPSLNFLYLHVTIKLLNEFSLWKLHKSWEFLQDTKKGIKNGQEENGQDVPTFTKKCSKNSGYYISHNPTFPNIFQWAFSSFKPSV